MEKSKEILRIERISAVILKKAVGVVARALKMLKMEYFFVKFWRSRTVTSAGMREGRATHDRMDAGGRAAPGAAAEPKFNEKILQIQHIKRPQ